MLPFPSPLIVNGNDPLKDFKYFCQQWKNYCIASGINKVDDNIKLAHLRLVIGRDANELIDDELNLTEEDAKNSENILKILERYFSIRVNTVHMRFLFNQLVQEENESIDDFLKKLMELGKLCKFQNYLDEIIRDKFIVGLRDQNIKLELLNDPDLTLEKAIVISKKNNSDFEPQAKKIKIESMEENELNNSKLPPTLPIHNKNVGRPSNNNITTHISAKNEKMSNAAICTNNIKTNNVTSNTNSNTDHAVITSTSNNNTPKEYLQGSFLLLKTDYKTDEKYPDIWKIDGCALLQKFMPFQDKNFTYYKNSGIYSGWNINNKDQYYPITVKFRQQNRKEHIVQFDKSSVQID